MNKIAISKFGLHVFEEMMSVLGGGGLVNLKSVLTPEKGTICPQGMTCNPIPKVLRGFVSPRGIVICSLDYFEENPPFRSIENLPNTKFLLGNSFCVKSTIPAENSSKKLLVDNSAWKIILKPTFV